MKIINKFRTIEPYKQDHLFVTCASFEKRCLGAIKYASNYHAKKVLMYHFSEPCPKRDELAQELLSGLDSIGPVNVVRCEHGKANEYVKPILSSVTNFGCQLNDLKVTLDISTFPKLYLLEILRILGGLQRPIFLQVLYTKPKYYAAPEEGSLSYGIKDICVPPGYWGNVDPGKEDVLVVLLGFEEERVKAVIEDLEPNKVILLLAKRGTSSQWNGYSERYNHNLLEQAEPGTIKPISAIQPIQVMKCLERLWSSKKYSGKKLNYFILPLGPKPQIIGVYWFFTNYPQVSVIYGQALRHNEPYYSRGIGKMSNDLLRLPMIE